MEEQKRKRELERQERSKEWADRKRERMNERVRVKEQNVKEARLKEERRCKGPVSNYREREKKGEQKRWRMRSDED